MKINILLPYKEKFDKQKASSVSITVSNNMLYSSFLDDIRVFGQQTDDPIFKKNFYGIKYSLCSFRSKNNYLADQLSKYILKTDDNRNLVEIHNRPYLVKRIKKRLKTSPISLFLHNNPKEMKGAKSRLERKELVSECAAIFCVSEFIKKQFLEGLSGNCENVFVLYNGVERKLTKFPEKKKEVLYVGRIVPEKGVEIYVDTVKLIAPKFTDWSFNLIGSSKLGALDKSGTYAEKISKKFLDIGAQAKFFGFKNKKFVDEKMKSGSIIVIPSLWQEPFGLVAAEGMSNGMAIIAANSGGIPEIIGKNGVLINDINKDKLKVVLTSLLSNQEKRIMYQKRSWKNFKFSSIHSSKNLDDFRKMIFQNHY